MRIINEKYRALKPSIHYLTDEVVIAQAWKKSHNYIRNFNWYADTLALDMSALGIETNAVAWADQLKSDIKLHDIELVPAAKSNQWGFGENGWGPINSEIPLRPLAHLTIRDQTWATAIMLCIADAVETAQGNCSSKDQSFLQAQHNNVFSYGNRLQCDWNDGIAWFRWGNSDVYRKFFTDYQNFLKRPVEIGRHVSENYSESDSIYVVSLDLSKFFDMIDRKKLIDRCRTIAREHKRFEKYEVTDEEEDLFWAKAEQVLNWEWADKEITKANDLNLKLKNGLPQGLVASGFFANAYMIEFDKFAGSRIGLEVKGEELVIHDYCRYVDDIRLVVSTVNLDANEIEKEINDYISKLLLQKVGEDVILNVGKTKVTKLSDLDNSGSMSSRIEMLQNELSGPCDRDSIDNTIGILESLLSTETENESSMLSVSNDLDLFNLTNYDHDLRSDTLKRFAANRLESLMQSKRKLFDFKSIETVKYLNESELLAKKLLSAWLKDPSLGLVLRKAMEVYPSPDIFEPVIEKIFTLSDISSQKTSCRSSFMIYILSDLFRCGIEFNGFFQYVKYPESTDPKALLDLLARYAQQVVASENIDRHLLRQALMFLATVNKPVLLCEYQNSKLIQVSLHKILVNVTPQFKIQQNALFEIAAQITGDVDTFASLFISYLPAERQLDSITEFAKRGGPFWEAIWKRLKTKNKNLSLKFKWAAPISIINPKPVRQRLSKVISSEHNGFVHESALIKLALGLLDAVDKNVKFLGKSPHQLKIKVGNNYAWDSLYKPEVKSFEITKDNTDYIDLRFVIPKWVSSQSDDDNSNKSLYWIGTILRSAVLGGADYTGNRWNRNNITTYKGLRTCWYKRRIAMMHSPETLTGEYATVSDWFADLMMRCLQWPGFESTFVQHEDIRSIDSIESLVTVLTQRLEKLNLLYCKNLNLPVIPTLVKRPSMSRSKKSFRIVTVQQLLPRTSDFSASDPELSNTKIRSLHRNHLLDVCSLTWKTLVAKLSAEGVASKPSADLIVFPEVSVHIDDQDIIKRLADKTGAIIFAGIVFTDRNGDIVNFARWFIPSYRESGRQWVIRDQGKYNMTEPEKAIGITGYRPCQHIIEVEGDDDGPFRLTGAICYDATDIQLAADLREKTDLFVIAAHNKDVNTFDNMAAALHYHMYQHVVITNIGEYGGSTIQAPFKEPYHRLISHVHGTEQISINMADIDLAAFRRAQKKYKAVKTKPAGM